MKQTAPPASETARRIAAIDAAGQTAAAGRPAAAARELVAMAGDVRDDPVAREALIRALHHAGRFREGAELALESGAGDLGALSGLAACCVAVGDLEGAETAFNRLIYAHPTDGAAYYNRCTLRRQDESRVDQLRAALAGVDAEGEIPVRFALAKTLEDLGRFEESFAELRRGVELRRRRLSYRVEMDVDVMQSIAKAFDARLLAGTPAARLDRSGPIFVLGLPRSGTTLVDRILSSHAEVTSLGEIADVAAAVIETASGARDRASLIRASAQLDPQRLAERLRERLAGHEARTAFVIDKTPVNFLYVGLIARALPEARIVHLRRAPMDVGYALYKTLFRTGCPYSYDLVDIGRYIAAYTRLMEHWRAALPGRLIEVDYEGLVEDLEGQARRIVDACGLDWQDACRDFHLNASPSSTASAAQVRRPVYRDSVGLWRRYAAALAPLRETLEREGVL